jgi:acetyl esterase/lipase
MRSRLTLGASLINLSAAIWIVVSAPVAYLLPLGVGAPELSAWLLAVAVILVLLGVGDLVRLQPPKPDSKTTRNWLKPSPAEKIRRKLVAQAKAALVLSCIAATLSALPLMRAALAARRFDVAMRAAFGDGYLRDVAPNIRAGMRPKAIVVADLFYGIDTRDAGATSEIEFARPQGVPLRMQVYGAMPAERRPAIVQIYGGGWQRGNPGDDATFARYFAARGYVVFAIDYRHAPQSRWPAQSDDVRTALAWIRQHGAEYGADVSRLALWGRSAGAHLALLAAYMPGGPPVRAVVSYYGPTDLVRGYREPPAPDPLDVRTVLATLLGGTPDDRPDAYRDASPLTYADHPLPPTLLVHGVRDHIVRHEFAEALHERLRVTGTRSVLLEIPWSEHAFDRVTFGPAAQLSLYHTERFLAWATSK